MEQKDDTLSLEEQLKKNIEWLHRMLDDCDHEIKVLQAKKRKLIRDIRRANLRLIMKTSIAHDSIVLSDSEEETEEETAKLL